MYEELRKEAKEKVEARMGFYITAIIFAFVSVILIVVSFYVGNASAAFWVRFPILILGLVLLIIYISVFGLPGSGMLSKDWQDAEVEREMAKLFYQKKPTLPPPEELSEEDRLELKELERLKKKWEWGEDIV